MTKKKLAIPEPQSLKEMQDQTLAEKISGLLATGMSQAEIERSLGMSHTKLMRLMRQNPEIVKQVHEDVRHKAVLMRPRALKRLQEISEQDENLNAAVKATEAIDKRAGISFAEQPGGVSIQIFGQQVNIAETNGADLRTLALEMAAKLGPDAEKVIAAEFTLERPPEPPKRAQPTTESPDAGSQ